MVPAVEEDAPEGPGACSASPASWAGLVVPVLVGVVGVTSASPMASSHTFCIVVLAGSRLLRVREEMTRTSAAPGALGSLGWGVSIPVMSLWMNGLILSVSTSTLIWPGWVKLAPRSSLTFQV